MIGTTGLANLRIDCIVGIYPHERTRTQPLFLDVELDSDFASAAQSDAIGDTVDYDLVRDTLTTLLVERRFQLIEALAEAGVAAIFARFPHVVAVRLTVKKPAAVNTADHAFVRVARSRNDVR